jgi:RNA polymerase sigma-70 factor (ECF subfamily)
MPQLGGSTAEDVRSPRRVEPDEAELVRRAQLGSSAAFDKLVLTRGPDLYRYLLVRLRNESDARDALQETMTAAWRGLPALREPVRFWPWLVAIAARKAAAIARSRVREVEYDVELLSYEDEDVLELRDAIGSLPEHLRDVLVLRFQLQLTEREVAEALGIRVGTVKSRSARARRALEELLR